MLKFKLSTVLAVLGLYGVVFGLTATQNSSEVYAQANVAQFNQDMILLNQTSVTRNANLNIDEDLFEYRIMNSNKQIIGTLDDLIVNEAGRVERTASLVKTVIRQPRVVYNEYEPSQFRENLSLFEVSLVLEDDPNMIEEMELASALSSLEPSAGGTSYSVKAMAGKDVSSQDGRFLGRIKNVVFDNDLNGIAALLLERVPGARRSSLVALPYDQSYISFNERFGKLEVLVENDKAQAFREFAKDFEG